jgi:hypothetical protein
VYPKCAGKPAWPTCPWQRFCQRDNTPAGLFGPSLLLVATTIAAAERDFAAPGLAKLAFMRCDSLL